MRKLLFTAVLTYLVCNSLAGHLVVPFSTVFAQTTTITNTTTSATANNRNSSATADTTIKSRTPKIITTPQEDIPNMSLEERTRQAEIVIEGSITKRFFVPTHDGHYRVAVEVEVYKLFKGKGVKKHIIVLGNEDYATDEYKEDDNPYPIKPDFIKSLKPCPTDEPCHSGFIILFLQQPTASVLLKKQHYPIFQFIDDNSGRYGSHMEAIGVVFSERNVPFMVKLDTVDQRHYKKLQQYTGKKFKTLKRRKTYIELSKTIRSAYSESQIPVITSVSPDIIASGHLNDQESVLTIHGQNLGTTKRQIFLINANSGGFFSNGTKDLVPISPQFVTTWEPTSIVIKIPSRGSYYTDPTPAHDNINGQNMIPGSGILQIAFPAPAPYYVEFIETPNQQEDPVINYSVTNYTNLVDYSELHLYDTDSSGNNSDFTFVYDTAFYNNKLALAAFRRALNTWRTETGVRFTEECGGQPLCLNDGLLNKRIKVGACFTYPN